MNDPRTRKRVLWLAAIGGVLLFSLLFITLLAPAPRTATTTPVIRTADAAATGASSGESAETSPSEGFSLGGGDMLSLGLRLGLVAVIIAASIAGLRWWGRKTMGPKSSTGFLRVVDTLPVGNGRTIHLVALGERVIAVGATAQQLSYLNELSDDESRQVLEMAPRPGDQSITGFAAELFQTMRRDTHGREGAPRQAVIGQEDAP